jgi:tetratricopeptide (TPR) repeat protein
MRSFRFRLRTLLIAVVVLAPLLAFGIKFIFYSPLDEMYGPEGQLASQQRFYVEVSDGSSALQVGRYLEAEKHFRSALELFRSPSRRKHMKDHVGDEATPSLGLADALAGQGRSREAEPFYERSLSAHRALWGSDRRGYPEEDKIVDHYAATLRGMGRMTQADELAARTKKIRERSVQESGK